MPRRSHIRYPKSKFASTDKRQWEHRFDKKALQWTGTLDRVIKNIYTWSNPGGGVSQILLLKEIQLNISLAPQVDTSPPYGNSQVWFAWGRVPVSLGLPPQYKDPRTVWSPSPVALHHLPVTWATHRTFKFPKIEVGEYDAFSFNAYVSKGSSNIDVSVALSWMEALHGG